MNDDILAIFMKYLFAEEKRQFMIPPRQVKRILADLREKSGPRQKQQKG